jgi:hypothetical protein
MDNPHALRSKGWAGLAFVVLIIASVVLSGGAATPAANADPGAVAAYLAAHQHGLLIAGWLAFPTVAFFLWFVVGMSRYLGRMGTNDEGLPGYALAGGIYTAAVALLGALLSTALAFTPPGAGGLHFIWALTALANGAFIAMGLAVFVFAVAHSMRRHNSGPIWLAWLGYITALGQAAMSFGMFYPSGIAFDNALIGLILGFVLFVVWMIAVSGTLIAQGSRQLEGAPAAF